MDALTILKSIIEDGYLSESNMQRGRSFLDRVDQLSTTRDLQAVLFECREQHDRGDSINAIRRYRSAAGCGLREAHDAVTRGASFGQSV